MKEIPRIKFEKGKVVIDIFTPGNPTPLFHVKGQLSNKETKNQIKVLKEKFGNAMFSDVKDFINIMEREIKERFTEDFESFEKLKKHFDDVEK